MSAIHRKMSFKPVLSNTSTLTTRCPSRRRDAKSSILCHIEGIWASSSLVSHRNESVRPHLDCNWTYLHVSPIWLLICYYVILAFSILLTSHRHCKKKQQQRSKCSNRQNNNKPFNRPNFIVTFQMQRKAWEEDENIKFRQDLLTKWKGSIRKHEKEIKIQARLRTKT